MSLHVHHPVQANTGADMHRKLQQKVPDLFQTTGKIFSSLPVASNLVNIRWIKTGSVP